MKRWQGAETGSSPGACAAGFRADLCRFRVKTRRTRIEHMSAGPTPDNRHPVSVCPKADTAGRLRPEGRTTIAIGSPRRPGPGTMRGAGARSTRCRDLNSQDGAFACLAACRARRDSSRADFCYLTRSPNNMPVRIVDYVLARSATWLARPERFELPTPRFVVWCFTRLLS